MFAQPKLTICVPSRNRQFYFQETIRSLLVTLRLDVEFVFADNSDDTTIMRDWIKHVLDDPRVIFLPAENRVLSMMDNWERCVEAATGEFICIIGDDDYVDPDVVGVLARVQDASEEPVDAFMWQRLYYNWPDNRPFVNSIAVQLKSNIYAFPTETVYDVFFSWASKQPMPNSSYSIYHGAVSRRIMDEIKTKFSGRYFEHPVVDIENVCKILTVTKKIYFSERCFSVMGSCVKSNSARSYSTTNAKTMYAEFMTEAGTNLDDGLYGKGFPFPHFLGSAACVAQTQHWFLTTYGYKRRTGWEPNFVTACAANCSVAHDNDYHDFMVGGYRAALNAWMDGKFAELFLPAAFNDPKTKLPVIGVVQSFLFLHEAIGNLSTPAEFYHLVSQMIVPLSDIALNFTISNKDLKASFSHPPNIAV